MKLLYEGQSAITPWNYNLELFIMSEVSQVDNPVQHQWYARTRFMDA